MPSSPRSPRSLSSDAVVQTLAWVRQSGFRPVPLHPRSKAAVNRKYVEPDYQPPSDDTWRHADLGVGVVTGPRHAGPVDVDLDCAEAVHFARVFLPRTPAVFGRKSKRASHYLYRVTATEMAKRAYNDPVLKKDTTIVEVRADGGHQTVFPGSVHQDTGEVIEWDDVPFPEVPTVDADVLVRAVRKVAIAAVVARHMWHDGQRNEVTKHLSGLLYYCDWTEDEAAELIEAVMAYCGDDDRTRRPTVRNTYQKGERGGKVTGAGRLREFLKDDKLVDRVQEWAGSLTVNLLQDYNERYAVVLLSGKFRVACTDVAPGNQPVFQVRDDFLHWKAHDRVEIDGKLVSKARLWVASPRHRSYHQVDFLPGVEDPVGTLNLWTGWATPPASSGVGSCAAWMELLTDVVCGGDAVLSNWMLHWFANIVREPMSKSLTAPVLIGEQGAGKSLLLAYFGRILGPAYVVVTDERHVHGHFNSHMANALLLHSEEALYGGERKHRGIIKSLITDEFRMFEPKGIDARQVRNYLRLVLTSNEQHAAPAEAGDRRFTVVDLGDRKLSRELLARVLREMSDEGGPAALHRYLLDMPYDPTVPRVNVKNEALNLLKSINFSPLESWWHEALSVGQVLPDYLNWATKPEKDDWPEVVSSRALHTSMTIALRDRSVRQIPSEAALAQQLDRLVGARLVRTQRSFTNPMLDDMPQAVKLLGERHSTVVNMPALESCRRAFERHVGQKLKWPSDLPDEDRGTRGHDAKY